jgi:5-methylthioadenosine/S-adenosylhomocysteine deaminase
MKLAKGVAPVPRLLGAGINVAIGVDGMDDLFNDMRQMMLMQGMHSSNPGVIPPSQALEMTARGGSAALGLGDELGSIEVGKRADLVCIDVSTAHLQPVLDPIWTVVNRVHGHDVAHVIVDGEVVVKNGRLTKVDEFALVEEAQGVSTAFLRRAGITTERVWAGPRA